MATSSQHDTVYTLPAYRMGPYEMRAIPAVRCQFEDKRRRLEADWSAGVVRIDVTTTPVQAVQYYLRHLIVAIHYRSGLNDTCDEEAYTHSLATGLVELARSNPYFWEAFIELLERTLRPGSGWLEAAGGLTPAEAESRPKLISYNGRGCRIVDVSLAYCTKMSAYGFYSIGEGLIELCEGLNGQNMALISIHEVIHFLHECEGLGDASTEQEFKLGQTRMLLKFWKSNPKFWRWWLSVVNPQVSPSVHEKLAA